MEDQSCFSLLQALFRAIIYSVHTLCRRTSKTLESLNHGSCLQVHIHGSTWDAYANIENSLGNCHKINRLMIFACGSAFEGKYPAGVPVGSGKTMNCACQSDKAVPSCGFTQHAVLDQKAVS